MALQSGLDYLRTLLYPFASVGLDHFAVHRSRDGNILISFDPEILPDETPEQDQRSGAFDGGSELAIFHGLCQKTFDGARKRHYKFLKIQPTYIDEFDTHHDLDQDRFEECEVDDGTLPDASFTASCIPSSPRPPPKSTPRAEPRRELVWKYQNHETVSLENISRQFNDFLHTSSTELAFNRRRGRYATKTAHRCPGYTRIEITLTPDIARSALVSHLTPTPHEICPVCKETVKDAEIFACICGSDDNESIPTVRCSTCLEWHHRPCVKFFKDEDRSFVCQCCQAGAAATNNESPFANLQAGQQRNASADTLTARNQFGVGVPQFVQRQPQANQHQIPGAQNVQAVRMPQAMQQPQTQQRNTLAAADVLIQRLKHDYTTIHLPFLRQVEIPMAQLIEYNQHLENAFSLASEIDQMLQIVVSVLQKEGIVRKLIAIICTIQHQHSSSSTGSPRYVITLELLLRMVGELQRILEMFNLASNNMRMNNNQRLAAIQTQQRPHHQHMQQQVMKNNTMPPPNTAMGTQDRLQYIWQVRSPIHRPPNPGPPSP